MRSSLKLLAVATLMLPGCILVARDGGGNSSDGHGRSYSSLEQRVAELESQIHHMQEECEMSACKCMGAEKEHGDAGTEHGAQPGAH